MDYDDEVRLLAPLAAVGNGQLGCTVSSIYAPGSTNLSGGWLKGSSNSAAPAAKARGRFSRSPTAWPTSGSPTPTLSSRFPRLGELGVAVVADLGLRYVSVGDEIAARELARVRCDKDARRPHGSRPAYSRP